jgi:hypothetical protein
MVLLRISVSDFTGFLYHDISGSRWFQESEPLFRPPNSFTNVFLCGATAEVLYVSLLDGISNQHHPQWTDIQQQCTLSDCQVSTGFKL